MNHFRKITKLILISLILTLISSINAANTQAQQNQAGPFICYILPHEGSALIFRGIGIPPGIKVMYERFENPGGRVTAGETLSDADGYVINSFTPTEGYQSTTITLYPDVSPTAPVPDKLCEATYRADQPGFSNTSAVLEKTKVTVAFNYAGQLANNQTYVINFYNPGVSLDTPQIAFKYVPERSSPITIDPSIIPGYDCGKTFGVKIAVFENEGQYRPIYSHFIGDFPVQCGDQIAPPVPPQPQIPIAPSRVVLAIQNHQGEGTDQEFVVGEKVKIFARVYNPNLNQPANDCLPTEGNLSFRMGNQNLAGQLKACVPFEYTIGNPPQQLVADFQPAGTDISEKRMGPGSDSVSLKVISQGSTQPQQPPVVNPQPEPEKGIRIESIYLEHPAGWYEIYPNNQTLEAPVDLTYQNTFLLKVSYYKDGVKQPEALIKTYKFNSVTKADDALPVVSDPPPPAPPVVAPPPPKVSIQGVRINNLQQWVDKGTTISSNKGGQSVGSNPFYFVTEAGDITVSTTVPDDYKASYAYCLDKVNCARNFTDGNSFRLTKDSGFVDVWWMYTYAPAAVSCKACLPEGTSCSQQCQKQFGKAEGMCGYPTSKDSGRCCVCGSATSGNPTLATVSGPQTIDNQNPIGTFSASGQGTNLRGVEVYRIRRDGNESIATVATNFKKIVGSATNCINQPVCPIDGSWNPTRNDNGTWVIVVNAYADRDRDGQVNELNDNCTSSPNKPAGWTDCGPTSRFEVTVNK